MVTISRTSEDAIKFMIEATSWEKLDWLFRKMAMLLRDPDQRALKMVASSRMIPDGNHLGHFALFGAIDPEWGNCIIQFN